MVPSSAPHPKATQVSTRRLVHRAPTVRGCTVPPRTRGGGAGRMMPPTDGGARRGDGGGDRRVALFAALDAAERERLSRAAADISLVPGEYAAHEGDERALFAVLEGRIEAVKLVDGIERVVGERRPGDVFGEVPIALGTVFPVGLPRGGGVARHADRAARLPRRRGRGARRRQGGRQAGGPPDRRLARAAGPRRRAAAAARDRGRASLGRVLRRAAALPRPQPDHVHAGSRPTRRTPRSSGAARCRPTETCRRSASSTARPWCGRSSAGWPSCSASAPRPDAAEYDTVIVGAGPAGPGRGRVRGVGGPAHDRGRARGARRPGRHVVADRELPRLPVGRVGRRAGEPRAAAGAQARRRDPRHPVDHADRRRDPPGAPRRRRRPAGADDHPRLRRRVAAAVDRGLRPARRQGHLLRRGAQRGAEHPRPGRPHRRRGQLGGAGGAVLLHPRAERDDPLPRRRRSRRACRATSSTSSRRGRTSARCSGPRWRPRTATSRSRRSTSATPRPARRPGSSRAGCSSSSAPTPRRRGCRPRSRSTTAATCSPAPTCAPRDAGTLDRDPYLLETSVPGIFACGDVRFGPVKRVAAAVGEGSMAIAFVHQYLREAGVADGRPAAGGGAPVGRGLTRGSRCTRRRTASACEPTSWARRPQTRGSPVVSR